ncbi:MAG: Hpt domain-containing protein, partial [Chloroflexi bacterium]|nr:Hpt domain-containing protein [Chloroflexota bacterium]
MNTVFDIAEDELQIFLAEVDEHLQTLDEGLVQLERTGGTPELLQAIFRAAHTLKGSAGMIGHRRMADLTHAMETALDGLRKGTLAVSTPLVDACLEALDALKLLRNEVADGEIGPVDIAPLADRLSALGRPAITPPAAPPPSPVPAPAREQRSVNGRRKAKGSKRTASNKQKAANSRRKAGKSNGRAPAASNGKTRSTLHAPPSTSDSPGLLIRADIAEDSIASAARAFQIVLALQALGEVHDLQPPQSVIETAAPVRQLTARLATDKSGDEIRQAIAAISEIERLAISGEEISLTPAPPAPPKPQPDES